MHGGGRSEGQGGCGRALSRERMPERVGGAGGGSQKVGDEIDGEQGW